MIRRVFLSVLNADHAQRGMLQAFRSVFGAPNVRELDYLESIRQGFTAEAINDAFVKNVTAFKPDWVFLQLQDTGIIHHSSLETLHKIFPHMVISHWTGDLRPQVSPYLASICRVATLTLISSTGQIPLFKAAGAKNVRYCQIGLDWDEDVVGEPPWEPAFKVPDVVFIGTNYGSNMPGTHDRELGIIALMDAGVNLGIVGSNWADGYPVIGTCPVKAQHHVWKRAKIGLNINNYNDVERYYSDRQLIAMASGTCVVAKRIPKVEEEFKDGIHCFFYDEPFQLVEIVTKLLKTNEADRLRVGRAGRMEVMRNHSWFSRILDLLPVIEELHGPK